MTRLAARFLLPLLASSAWCHAQIFADFETSLGDFSCELHFEEAPKTTANFVGLAEGSRPWIDLETGGIMHGVPFYDGLTFHRVIPNFMNQTGSPNGQGTDGPGYSFQDEISDLKHEPFVLSMANSGPASNGSQFFVTAAATAWLDGLHTVFGKVVEGQEIVSTINQVPTNAQDKPLEPVVIHSVRIRREGQAAEAFDIHAQGLPTISSVTGRLDVVPGVSEVLHPSPPLAWNSVVHWYSGTDLAAWTKVEERFFPPDAELPSELSLGEAEGPRSFHQLVRVSYPPPVRPGTIANRTLTLDLGEGEILAFTFNAAGTGGEASYTIADGLEIAIVSVNYVGSIYGASWVIGTNPGGGFYVRVRIEDEDEELLKGTISTLQQWNGSEARWVPLNTGSFTLTK